MTSTDTAPPEFAYCTGWNHKLREQILGRVWLTEDQARARFEVEHTYFQVLDPVVLHCQPPSYILHVRSTPGGWQKSERYNAVRSIMVSADLRATDGRFFVSRRTLTQIPATGWTSPPR